MVLMGRLVSLRVKVQVKVTKKGWTVVSEFDIRAFEMYPIFNLLLHCIEVFLLLMIWLKIWHMLSWRTQNAPNISP